MMDFKIFQIIFVNKDMFLNKFKYKPVPWAGAPL